MLRNVPECSSVSNVILPAVHVQYWRVVLGCWSLTLCLWELLQIRVSSSRTWTCFIVTLVFGLCVVQFVIILFEVRLLEMWSHVSVLNDARAETRWIYLCTVMCQYLTHVIILCDRQTNILRQSTIHWRLIVVQISHCWEIVNTNKCQCLTYSSSSFYRSLLLYNTQLLCFTCCCCCLFVLLLLFGFVVVIVGELCVILAFPSIPQKPDMNYMIFNMRLWCFCMHIHTGHLCLWT